MAAIFNRRCLYPRRSMGHSLLFLWGPEANWDFTRWCQIGGLWNFTAFHGAIGLMGFMLRQIEVARLWVYVLIMPLHFLRPSPFFCRHLFNLSLGQSSWFFWTQFWGNGDLSISAVFPGIS